MRLHSYRILILCAIGAFLLVSGATADLTVVWNKTYGKATANDAAWSIVAMPGGAGFLFAGDAVSSGAGTTDGWVVQIDGSGNEVWNRPIGKDRDDQAFGIARTADQNYIAVGSMTQTTASNVRHTDAWAAKYTPAGDQSWLTAIGDDQNDEVAYGISTVGNGAILVGTRAKNTGGGFAATDALVVKVSESGGVEWQKTFGQSGTDDVARAVVPLSDGGYLIAGSTRSFGAAGMDAWVLRIDSTGKEVWSKIYGGSGPDEARALVATADGNIVVVGSTITNNDQNAFAMKIAPDGDVIWSQSYGEATVFEAANAVIETRDGGYMVAGKSGPDALLLKLNADGQPDWSQTFGGANPLDTANSVLQVSDTAYVFAGTFDNAAGSTQNTDAWVVMVDVTGQPATPTRPSVSAGPGPSTGPGTGPTAGPTTGPTPGPTPEPEKLPKIAIDKLVGWIAPTTGNFKVDGDENGPGPTIPPNIPVGWYYVVYNTGPVPVQNIQVVDSINGPLGPGDIVYKSMNGDDVLDVGEYWVYLVDGGNSVDTSTLSDGYYENTATVTGSDDAGHSVSATDVSRYTNDAQARMSLVKMTNGALTSSPPGPITPVGAPVRWDYWIYNTGSTDLTHITLTDSKEGEIPYTACTEMDANPGDGILQACGVWHYTWFGAAVDTSTLPNGYYENTATVTATTASATGTGHYTPQSPDRAITSGSGAGSGIGNAGTVLFGLNALITTQPWVTNTPAEPTTVTASASATDVSYYTNSLAEFIASSSTTEVTPTEVTPTEVTPTEVTPTEVTPTEVTPTEVTPTEVTPTEVTPTEVTPTEVTPTEVTPTEVTPTEVTPTKSPIDRLPPTEEETTPYPYYV